MPQYTISAPLCMTLSGDIKEGTESVFNDQIIDPSFVSGVGDFVYEIDNKLTPDSKLADGVAENFKDLYYKNVYSAQTTAGYTNMEQHLFVNKAKVISGWQTKS
jgi:hypothetical protein